MRETRITAKIKCDAPEDVFSEDYEDILPKNQVLIEKHNGIPCEGTGHINIWCEKCLFCSWFGTWEE